MSDQRSDYMDVMEDEEVFHGYAEPPPEGPPMTPLESLDLHIDLRSWLATDEAARFMTGFLRAYVASNPRKLTSPLDFKVASLLYDLRTMLEMSSTYYVTPEVAALTAWMGSKMPPDQLKRTDLPEESGFLVLGAWWRYMDMEVDHYLGKIPIRVVTWEEVPVQQGDGTQKPGIMVTLWSDREGIRSYAGETSGHDVPFDGYAAPLYLVDMWGWTYDSWWEEVGPRDEVDPHHQTSHVGEMRRQLLALWRFMQEEVIDTARRGVPRAHQRRWQRSKVSMAADRSIVVLHLRRHVTPGHGSDGSSAKRTWRNRWWVSGHWRYNAKSGAKDIWVRPHLKGPDGLPITGKDRLITVYR